MKIYASDEYLNKKPIEKWDKELMSSLETTSKNCDMNRAKHILESNDVVFDYEDDEIYIQENEVDETYERIF